MNRQRGSLRVFVLRTISECRSGQNLHQLALELDICT